jgi:hypothetical protein
MWCKIRLFRPLAVICLCGVLLITAANPAGAVPYSKKPIYDGFNLYASPLSGYPTFQFSNNGDIVYQTRVWSDTLGTYVYSLQLYRQGDGSVTPIPSGVKIKFDLQINDQGQVVWLEESADLPHYTRIYIYKNGGTIPISSSEYRSGQPRLNNQGQVVYAASVYLDEGSNDEEIFLYDGNAYGQITHQRLSNPRPVINASGQLAWYSSNYSPVNVYFYNGSEIILINAMGDATKLQLSDDGWVMWEISGVQDYTLYLYKGGDPAINTVQLTSKIYYLSPDPQFGASGQVVWIERDADTGYKYLAQYLSGITTLISRADSTYHAFNVNRKGQIAFNFGYDIYLSSNNTLTQISPSSTHDFGGYLDPIINANGQVVYFGGAFWQFDYTSHQAVYAYNRGTTMLDDAHAMGYDRNLQLINNGQIAWFEQLTGYLDQPNEMKIWLATPLPAPNGALYLLLLN